MNDETNEKVFRLRKEDSFPMLINVITVRNDGQLYDDMYFHDGAHHGGGYIQRYDDTSWIHNMADYDLGFHEPYEGTQPDAKRLAEIQGLPEMTGAELWQLIKDDIGVQEINAMSQHHGRHREH